GVALAVYISALSLRDFRANLGQHRKVVRGFEMIDEEKGDGVALAEDVLQLERPIGGIDVDKHRADTRGGKLEEHPLGDVRGPEGDVLPGANADGEEAAGGGIDVVSKLLPGPAAAELWEDEGLAV